MGTDPNRFLAPALAAATGIAALYLLRRVAFRLLKSWAARTESRLDDLPDG